MMTQGSAGWRPPASRFYRCSERCQRRFRHSPSTPWRSPAPWTYSVRVYIVRDMAPDMSPAQFIAKWSPVKLSERAASQEHFIDLCRLLGQPTPAEHDATGAEYTFEKGVIPAAGASRGAAGQYGFADVWWRGKFGWEYKRKGKYRDLTEAYRQLCQYREALDNPPLLIVSDIAHTEIHTNFTGTAKQVHAIELASLDDPQSLDLLRRVFTDPLSFKPTITPENVTEDIAKQFSALAQSLRQFGHDAQTVAHFLMKCMFCLFAEDVDLLPRDLFTKLLERYGKDPAKLADRMTELFAVMRTGGDFGVDPVVHFNGGLFAEAPALRLTAADIATMLTAARSDWGSVEPAVFGTLFERSLDPNTRAKIGAHYTSREDIMLVVEPVILAPLRKEWEAVRAEVDKQLARRRKGKGDTKKKADRAIQAALQAFVHRLSTVRILDPACGSGNFLYVAIQQLLGLEKEVITFAAQPEIAEGLFPQIRPTQLHGIEINTYAAELAQVVIWIGYLQWMRDNGYIDGIRTPILEPLQTVECRDAILDLSDPDKPKPATWPEADFIIGNPPFLYSRWFRREGLQESYINALYSCYDIANGSDLCCYWFALAHDVMCSQSKNDSPRVRIGLLATQGIRGQNNREVLVRIVRDGAIFSAHSDLHWALDGANVHVSIVCFSAESPERFILDGAIVDKIRADLSASGVATCAKPLAEDDAICFRGSQKRGPFDVSWSTARQWLALPNAHGHSNCSVLRPSVNGADIAGRWRAKWIVDFGAFAGLGDAACFETPFAHVERNVKPGRDSNNDPTLRKFWWRHGRTQPEMRDAIAGNPKEFIASPRVAKFRLFTRLDKQILPDDAIIVFARSDDYFFGVLHSSIHELWARRMGTQLREAESGFRYTPTTCFETFPMPWAPGSEPTENEAYQRIAEAAKEINEQRERWLNPPEWVEPIAQAVDAEDDFADVPEEARALIRQSAIMARAAKDPKLKKRTLTNLYNERPTWLKLAHDKLDRAVLAAYAAIDPAGDWSQDWAEAWLDTGAGIPLPEDHALSARRKEVDQLVLANLLRINLERSDGT